MRLVFKVSLVVVDLAPVLIGNMKGLSLNLSEGGGDASLLLDRDKASSVNRLNSSINILLIHIGLR